MRFPVPAAIVIALAAVSLWACGDRPGGPGGQKGDGKGEAAEKEDPPSPVEVVQVETGPITDGLMATATVRARNQAEIRARAGGIVAALDVEEGATVSAGDRLARIDQPTYQSLIDKAKAQLEKARRDLRAAKALQARGVLPKQQVEDAEFQVRQARLEVRRLEDERKLGTVTAPIDGVVVSRAVERGEAISPGAPLFTVSDLSALEADLYVPERHLARIATGLKVDITADGIGDGRLEGRIERIAPTIDPRSGTVKVTVALGDGRTEPDSAPDGRRLRPGMYIQARIVLDTRQDAVLVPRRAIIYDNDRPFAFRIEDGVARKLALELGYADRDVLEVRSPVAAGDTVIVFGQRGLEEGARVKVVAGPGAEAAPGAEETPPAGAAAPNEADGASKARADARRGPRVEGAPKKRGEGERRREKKTTEEAAP